MSPAASVRDRRSPILGLLGLKQHHHGHHFGGHYGGAGFSGSSAQVSNFARRCPLCEVYSRYISEVGCTPAFTLPVITSPYTERSVLNGNNTKHYISEEKADTKLCASPFSLTLPSSRRMPTALDSWVPSRFCFSWRDVLRVVGSRFRSMADRAEILHPCSTQV
jgi:hypothetical protein